MATSMENDTLGVFRFFSNLYRPSMRLVKAPKFNTLLNVVGKHTHKIKYVKCSLVK